MLFDQKEPYIEINFKNGISMRSGFLPDAAEDHFMNTLNTMQDEGKINKILGHKSSRQNFKAA